MLHPTMATPSSPPEIIRVAIVEDTRTLREGLSILIGGTPGFECTGKFATMEGALAQIGPAAPDVALVDIGLPGISGIEGVRLLKQLYPGLVLLMLTVYDDDDWVFESLCAGACGYLLKTTPPARLLECIREAFLGGSPLTPEIARHVVTLFRDFRPPARTDCHLTPHETRLLRLLVEGHNYKTAAAELDVSVNTIGFHIRSIYEKLHVHSKSEAVARALRERLVP